MFRKKIASKVKKAKAKKFTKKKKAIYKEVAADQEVVLYQGAGPLPSRLPLNQTNNNPPTLSLRS